MKHPLALSLITVSFFATSTLLQAAENEILLKDVQNTATSLSIYNNNLGFVKDTRMINLAAGRSRIAFEGVASRMKPETAMLINSNVRVIEQNYDYNLLTATNILEESIGDTVKTAVTNPENGQDIFGEAKIINSVYGSPLLQFSYGIETNFPGRIIYEKLPTNLRTKPTLVIDLENKKAGSQNLELAYLTNGLSWKADYVAEINSTENLNLNGWVTLNNESGTDYKNAQVQLVAGSINQVQNEVGVHYRRNMMMAKGAAMDAAMPESTPMPSRQAFSDYYLYTLPFQTTINDKQSKQVSLMTKDNVKYSKEYRFNSPFYLGIGTRNDEFEKQNPQVFFKLVNDQASNLGEPLPSGTIRLYEKDKQGSLQFIGESSIEHSAVGQKIELNTGKAFDIYTSGKIIQSKSLAKNIREISVSTTFDNVKDEKAAMVFEQNFAEDFEILNETRTGENKNSNTRQWKFELKPQEKITLNFTVRLTSQLPQTVGM